MHGIVFEELREYVWRTHGAEEWASLLSAAAPGRRFYAPDNGYPDEELEALLAEISKRTGARRGELLREFGAFIAPTLVDLYRPLVSEEWNLLDLLEHVEETIHRVVRLDDPSAAPPRLRVERPEESRVIVHYNSERRMCDLAKGIVLGLQEAYAQKVVITDLACMLNDDVECTIEIATLA